MGELLRRIKIRKSKIADFLLDNGFTFEPCLFYKVTLGYQQMFSVFKYTPTYICCDIENGFVLIFDESRDWEFKNPIYIHKKKIFIPPDIIAQDDVKAFETCLDEAFDAYIKQGKVNERKTNERVC